MARKGDYTMNEPFTIYKLIILYTLRKADSPLTLTFISYFITEHGYTNYFNVQNAFSELYEEELIDYTQTYNTSYYSITEAGKETLSLFGSDLSAQIRKEISEYLKSNQIAIQNQVAVITDYTRLPSGDYLATCSIQENKQLLFETKLSVPTEQEAIRVCNNWRENNESLYAFCIKKLL